LADKVMRLPLWRAALIVLLAAALGVLLLLQAARPFRHIIAQRYVVRGDSAFLAQNFDGAAQEYDNALRYDASLSGIAERRSLALNAKGDIASARSFYAAHNDTEITGKIDEATQTFSDPKAALQRGVTLFVATEYSYARYPLEQAVALDPKYAEAWHYLAQEYEKLAATDHVYAAKATDAYATRDRLTSKYLNP
jgi:Tfp pilus assembly protein PilF